MIANSSEYKEYLASREWAVLREKVRERSGDKCERCKTNSQEAVHHLTYARIGRELLEDLQAICTPCHEFVSGKRDTDPAAWDLTEGEKQKALSLGADELVDRLNYVYRNVPTCQKHLTWMYRDFCFKIYSLMKDFGEI